MKKGEKSVPEIKLEVRAFKIRRLIKSRGIKSRASRIIMFPNPSFKNGR